MVELLDEEQQADDGGEADAEQQPLAAHLADHADDPRYDRYLADRARASLPYDTVATVDPSPDDAPSARTGERARAVNRALADAELARLGIRRPASSPP